MDSMRAACRRSLQRCKAKRRCKLSLTIQRNLTVQHLTADNIEVTEAEIAEAYEQVDPKAVRGYPQSSKKTSVLIMKSRSSTAGLTAQSDGTILGQKVTPIAKSQVYMFRVEKPYIRLPY